MAYDHRAVEQRWQAYWEENHSFRAVRRQGRPKFYVLDMFPYPSGSGLHVGHPEGYTATDILARFKRMHGVDVLHPMGWDAFGLPAEQHAIRTGTHPAKTTAENVHNFRRQLKSLGFSVDWEREVDTTDPAYVRWTQWIFLKLFERGLAFQAEIPVNWCPELGTVLSNEEVTDGVSEVGGFPVVRRPLRQWQLRITAYADRLANELEPLDWPETKQKQRDWIGRSEGAEVDFPLEGSAEKLRVFTTRPDTLYGATYMVIAPDHRLTLSLTTDAQREAVTQYVTATTRKSDLERTALGKSKTGIFTGAYAINPLSLAKIPIYTADYVLGSYGTGAIMAVPAHDDRDFEFAKAFDLPILTVVSPAGTTPEQLKSPDGTTPAQPASAFTGAGVSVQSGPHSGLPTAEMKATILDFLEAKGIGQRKINYKLRDWVFSRQRYWGEPIPIYFPVKTAGDPRRGDAHEIDYSQPIALSESELPLRLPELEDYKPGDPAGPLAKALEWRFFQKDGAWFARETNTMPQWAGSCWYYLRYLDPKNEQEIFSQQAYDDWMPVDLYVGGSEHAVLHLMYARFWHKVLFDIGVVKHPEPFTKLVHQGLILGMVYRWYAVLDAEGSMLRAVAGDDPEVEPSGDGLRLRTTGERVEARYEVESNIAFHEGRPWHAEHGVQLFGMAEKMSKSRGNVVNPDIAILEHGADSLRIYEMFMGPLEQAKPWQTSGILGCRRFLDRVHALGTRELSDAPMDTQTAKEVHRTVKRVTEHIDTLRFNTAIAFMMELVKFLGAQAKPAREAIEKLVLCVSPFAPHLGEELWAGLGHAGGLTEVAWPSFDEALCVESEIEMPIQINGKVRSRVRLAVDASESEAQDRAVQDETIQKLLEGKAVKKLIYVPGRILNLIVG